MPDEVYIDPPALRGIGDRLFDGQSQCKCALDGQQAVSSGMFGARRSSSAQAFAQWYHEEAEKDDLLVQQTSDHAEPLVSDAKTFEEQNERTRDVFRTVEG